jgi:hypothetical protein
LTDIDPNKQLREIFEIDKRLGELEKEKARLLSRKVEIEACMPTSASESRGLSSGQKISLFRSLFSGREDIFAIRWENKSGKVVTPSHATTNGDQVSATSHESGAVTVRTKPSNLLMTRRYTIICPEN